MSKFDIVKIVRIVCYTAGPGLIAYNLASFSFTKWGFYFYKDHHQLWFAIGVALVALGWFLKDWYAFFYKPGN